MYWNETTDNNISNWNKSEGNKTNDLNSYNLYFYHVIITFFKISDAINYFCLICGTILNLWILMAIIRSPQHRSRFRNKFICSMLFLHLIEIIAEIVVNKTMGSLLIADFCFRKVVVDHVMMVLNFIGNWQIVVIFSVFLAQTVIFNPSKHFSTSVVKGGAIALVVFPWLASIFVVPAITHTLHKGFIDSSCNWIKKESFTTFKSFETIFPLLLAILLLLIAVYIRKKHSRTSVAHETLQKELINQNQEPEGIRVYVAAVVVVVVCDFLELIRAIDPYIFYNYSRLNQYIVAVVSSMLSGLRVVLMPLPWLLLPDIREHLRTWIPWGRPAARDEQSVRYQREEA